MSLQKNKKAILKFLGDHLLNNKNISFSEHKLIQLIQAENLFDNLISENVSLLLFQKHFICMHALYILQEQLYTENLHLHISPLAIYLEALPASPTARALAEENNELASYYLDINNLNSATSDSVEELQGNFYKRYTAWLQADEAYSILGLEPSANWQQIQDQYRRLAQSSHPDKGGDSATFQDIHQAYRKLKSRHAKP